MKIFVLGSTGMLGRYVSTYLKSQNREVVNVTRNQIDAIYTNEYLLEGSLQLLDMEKDDLVINCIGLIKQKKDIDDLDLIKVNTIFPRILANLCEDYGVNLIHPSTDCVFSGIRGNYNEDDYQDAHDLYGKSKSLGDPPNATVIRTSIIGEELKGKFSFMAWIKSNENKTVNGYRNWIWNGITCLEFARICDDFIESNRYWKGVRHVFTDTPIAKDDLVLIISDIYKLNVTVNSIDAPESCDRSLTTIRTDVRINIPDYRTQIMDLYEYQTILRDEK